MDEIRTSCACGARLVEGAPWCHLCFAPVGSSVAASSAAGRFAPLGAAPQTGTTQPPPGSARTSRFQATDVTFGPVGRLVVTVLVLLPLAAFVAALLVAPAAGITGIVVWGGGIAPKALRDTWRRRPNVLR
ncbi:hypothetical protein ACPPVT_20555 [Angustibacter sp. McL0619]|uniref:hypothetical protein n=1 Tax=Angustibacter sp. McL0619 TaxID=3415676 RepID=UPI003CF920EF